MISAEEVFREVTPTSKMIMSSDTPLWDSDLVDSYSEDSRWEGSHVVLRITGEPEKNNGYDDISVKLGIYNTEPSVNWRMQARTTWARYLWRMRNYVISQLDGGEDTTFVEAQLFQDIDEIADSLKPFYGLVASKQVAQLMRAFVLTEIDIVKAVKARQNIEPLKARHAQQVEDFANFLGSANPQHWPKEAVKKIFGQLMACWQTEAQARQIKDWAKDVQAVDTGHRIVLAGQEDGTPPFSEIFARGVIAQFPDRFTE